MRRKAIFSQDQMEAFILGECDEELALQIEEKLFLEDDFYLKLERIKSSLVARQADGTLTELRSQQLSAQALRSPKLQAEIEQARAEHPRIAAAHDPARRSFFEQLLRPTGTLSFARIAVAATFVAIITALLIRPILLRSGRLIDVSNRGVEAPAASLPQIDANPIALFLSADVLRSQGNLPILRLPDDRRPIELQIEVRSHLQSHWTAAIQQSAHPVYRWDDLPVETEGPLHYVTLHVPAGTLRSGQYQVQLTASDPAVSPENTNAQTRTLRVISSN